jgi:hypothetical protein
VLVDGSQEATEALNSDLQAARRANGELSPFRRFVVHGNSLYQGDSVQVMRTQSHLGLKAGDLATLKHVAATPLPWFATVTLLLERTGKTVTISTPAFPHLQLAYALNHQAITGFECHRAFVLHDTQAGPMSPSLLAHAKQDAKLFVAVAPRPPEARHAHHMSPDSGLHLGR